MDSFPELSPNAVFILLQIPGPKETSSEAEIKITDLCKCKNKGALIFLSTRPSIKKMR